MKRQAVMLMAPLLLFSPGCAAVLKALPTVIQYVQDAQIVLDMIDRQAEPFFDRLGNEEVQQEYDRAMMTAKQTLQVALRTAKGADDLNQEQIDEAFAQFREAYRDLQQVLRRAGLLGVDGVMKAGPGHPSIDVPDPMALTPSK